MTKLPNFLLLYLPLLQFHLTALHLSLRQLLQFISATTAEVKHIILTSSSTTCSLDSVPTSLLKSCIDVLVVPITTLVNLSLSEGAFPTGFKTAVVQPLL